MLRALVHICPRPQFVMRELHHGDRSAWKLLSLFTPYRRIAEWCFALIIGMFLISTALMVHVRFKLSFSFATAFSQVILSLNVVVLGVLVGLMQNVKTKHGQGKKIKRAEAEKQRQKREAEMRGDPTGLNRKSKRASLQLGKANERLRVSLLANTC
jgi:hypothetical protein